PLNHHTFNHFSIHNFLKQIDSGHTQTDEILDNLAKQMALLAQSFRATLSQINNQLRTSSNTRNQATIQDGQQAMGAYRIELRMPMQVKENRSSVIIAMGLDTLHGTVLSRSVGNGYC
ncbi:hypothetical protein Tco_0141568, partial [Tanacetum coccineum]